MDFQVNGIDYKSGKLNAKQQFHIVRRMAPILSGVVGKSEGDVLNGIATALASLNDVDADFVLFGLLGCVERKDSTGGWGKVSTGENLMYQDIDLVAMMQIAMKAFEGNFSAFFKGLDLTSINTSLKPNAL